VPGKLRLNKHFAGLRTPPSAARHLHDGLGKPLRRPKVSTEKPLIRVENDDERDVGKVVTLRHHLRPNQDPSFARRHAPHDLFHVTATPDNVAIEARERYTREKPRERFFNTLRTLPHRLYRKPALWTARGQLRVESAVMTPKPPRGHVDRQSGVALVTRRDPSASGAKQRRCIAPTIQEHEHLPIVP